MGRVQQDFQEKAVCCVGECLLKELGDGWLNV